MNPFTSHTKQQGVTYSEHFGFAIGIACRSYFIRMLVRNLASIDGDLPTARF